MTEIKPREKYIRGYLVPYPIIKENKISFQLYRDITNEVQFVETFLSAIKDILENFFGTINDVTTLKLANDLYVLLVYSSLSVYWKGMVEDWITEKFHNNQSLNLNEFFNEDFKNISKTIKRFYTLFPADDRPGLNTSSLLVQLIATSALATCIALNSEENKITNKQFECLRFGAFFHEIGKPLSRYHVNKNSINLINTYFKDILSEDLFNDVIKILNGLEDESTIGLSSYLKAGSNLSLKSERLKAITLEILSDKGINLENFDNNVFWEEHKDDIERYTHEFLLKCDSHLLKQEPIKLEYSKSGDIALIRGDVRHIHEYTDHVNKLEELRNASTLLDHILSNVLVNKLIEDKSVLPEWIIYSSGGNIILFSPSSKAETITNFIEDEFHEDMKEGLEITTDYIYFYDHQEREVKDSFGDLYSKLAIKIGAKKNDLRFKGKHSIFLGSIRLCESCGSKPAVGDPLIFIGDEKYYCNSCKYKLNLNGLSQLSLQEKWRDLYDILKENLMEYISGVPYKEIEKKRKGDIKPFDPYKLAVINADGNLMSEFIAKSISLTDLFERISRISNSVDEIFEIIRENIRKYISIQDSIRFNMGTIYAGGDDMLFLIPGYLAIPISLTLTKMFYIKMGGKCTLSTGMFLCPNKFPIWTAISTSRELLSNAKKIGRKCDNNKNEMGAIDFQTYSYGITVPKYVKEKKPNDLQEKKPNDLRRVFSKRPFKVCYINEDNEGKQCDNEIHNILNIIVDENHQVTLNLHDNYENLYTFVNNEKKMLTSLDLRSESVLRDFRNKFKRILTFFTFKPLKLIEEKQMASTFVMYQTCRQKRHLGRNSYIKLFHLLGDINHMLENNHNIIELILNDNILLFDAIELFQFLSGGLS
ncbi:MAG: hypothetical protein V3V33_13145 [Candidatus Lokiarchaeia archaeon]